MAKLPMADTVGLAGNDAPVKQRKRRRKKASRISGG